MKFKFCSDSDCPLWVLAALNALSTLPAPVFRDMLHHVMDEQPVTIWTQDGSIVPKSPYLVALLVGTQYCYHALLDDGLLTDRNDNGYSMKKIAIITSLARELAIADDGVMEILKGTSLSSREESTRACAVVRWVLHQCWRCSCSSAQLMRDLLMLGVPRTQAAALAEAADSARDSYIHNVQTNGFMVNRVTDVKLTSGPEGTVDAYQLTLFTHNGLTGQEKKNELLLEKSQIGSLLSELKKALLKMDELDREIVK